MAVRRGSGEGSIFKQGERWVAVVTVTSAGGRQQRQKRTARTYGEARTRLRELQRDLAAGVTPSRTTVAGFLENWLGRQRAAAKSPNTIVNYEWAITRHILPALGHIVLSELRADDVDNLLMSMAENGKAKNTMMRVRAILVMALKDAERRSLVMKNVAALTSTPAGPRRESRSLTLDQARLLLAASAGDRLEAAWTTMLLLGLRPGEVCGLSWEDVQLDKGHLHVRHARLDEPGGTRIGRTKTRGSIRSLEMPDQVRRALVEHRRRQAQERLGAGRAWTDHGLVFTTTIGTPIDRWALDRDFAKVAAKAGLDHWQPRELRHSTVSLLSAAGVPLEEVADVTGHSTTRMTGEVYRHSVRPTVDAARRTMDRLFGPEPPTPNEASGSAAGL